MCIRDRTSSKQSRLLLFAKWEVIKQYSCLFTKKIQMKENVYSYINDVDGYDGSTITINIGGVFENIVDNKWLVPSIVPFH